MTSHVLPQIAQRIATSTPMRRRLGSRFTGRGYFDSGAEACKDRPVPGLTLTYDDAPCAVRPDLQRAHEEVWQSLARAGTWLTSQKRVAVAAEARNAWRCALCRERKGAVTPYAKAGAHDRVGPAPLEHAFVEVIHRVVTNIC